METKIDKIFYNAIHLTPKKNEANKKSAGKSLFNVTPTKMPPTMTLESHMISMPPYATTLDRNFQWT